MMNIGEKWGRTPLFVEKGVRPYFPVLRLLRRLVLGFLLERFPDGLETDKPFFVRRQLARGEKTRAAVRNLGRGLLRFLFAHESPLFIRLSSETDRHSRSRESLRPPLFLHRLRRARSIFRA